MKLIHAIVTMMRPTWLKVEKTTIFWMSFWVRTPVAIKGVVIAPKRNAVV